ncbi:MAG: hypothetical protein WD273_13970 [Trueperaceae bacterium]
MKRIAPLTLSVLALLLLAACSPSFSTSVGAFSTPIGNSLGRICWQEVDASGAPPISTATFRANATYNAGALAVTDRVELRFFGRLREPEAECTDGDSSANIVLSEPFELERETAQEIEVGGENYGSSLADLVNQGTFWLGASAAGNIAIGEESVLFEDGTIFVGF